MVFVKPVLYCLDDVIYLVLAASFFTEACLLVVEKAICFRYIVQPSLKEIGKHYWPVGIENFSGFPAFGIRRIVVRRQV